MHGRSKAEHVVLVDVRVMFIQSLSCQPHDNNPILALASNIAKRIAMEFEVIAKCPTTRARVSRMKLARKAFFSVWLSYSYFL